MLSLSDNQIGDAGAIALSKGIAVSFVLFCVFSFLVWATLPDSPPIPCHVLVGKQSAAEADVV